MPTINQLVRKGRKTTKAKSTAPALQHGWNSKNKTVTDNKAPQKKRCMYSSKNSNTKKTKLSIKKSCQS